MLNSDCKDRSKGSARTESCVTKSVRLGVFSCRFRATAPAITIAPAEQRRSWCVMRPWSCAVRTKSSEQPKQKRPTGPARIALPLPADGGGVPASSQGIPRISRSAALAWQASSDDAILTKEHRDTSCVIGWVELPRSTILKINSRAS